MVQVPESSLRPPEDYSVRQRIALLGVPVGIGASRHGSSFGPEALRAAGLIERLRERGCRVEDYGDLARPAQRSNDYPVPQNAKHYREIQAWIQVLNARAYQLARSGAIPIFLGGDHSLSMGSVNGVARYWREQNRDVFVLWLDAHADYNTPATTPSGNMHGMSAAFLCGETGLDHVLGNEPRYSIAPYQLELFGVRSIDPLEQQLLRDRSVAIVDMSQIFRQGVGALISHLIDKVAARNGVLHVSFDADFLDPSLAPGVGTAEAGGASVSDARRVMELLHDSGLVRSVDIVELNPLLDEEGRTSHLVVDLIGDLFG
jgi:arginase